LHNNVHRSRRRKNGYILLTLLLVVALMAFSPRSYYRRLNLRSGAIRNTEMIHRGVQYTRAIRGYYKKLGRYPTKLEDLENTNNLRYLRKHYKDPLNKNSKGLQTAPRRGPRGIGGRSFGGGTIPGATPAGSGGGLSGSGPSSSGFGGSSFGGSGSSGSAFGGSGVNSSGVFSQSSGFGGNSNSQTSPGQQGTSSASGSDATQASSQVAPGTAQGDTSSSGQQVVGGGPIVGVASICKDKTIREFNKKRKVQRVAVHLRSNRRPRRPDHHTLPTGAAKLRCSPLEWVRRRAMPAIQPGSSSSFRQWVRAIVGQSSSFGNNSNSSTPAPPAQHRPPPQQRGPRQSVLLVKENGLIRGMRPFPLRTFRATF
jgi:type II secretory pathway pseudopilin PulG